MLLSKKYSVHVFDKARGLGADHQIKNLKKTLSFDHGVQYISPKSKKFRKFTQNLLKKKIFKTWDGNHLDFTFEKKPNNVKYIGKKGNNALIKYQIKRYKTIFYVSNY